MSEKQAELRYRVLPDRMPPIAREKMTEAQKKTADSISAGPRGAVKGPFWPMLRSPGFADTVQKVGAYIRFECKLDKRLNELAAIIGARAWSQQFEWWAHYRQAVEAGLKPEIGDAIAEGRRPTGMAQDEEVLYDFLTELLTNQSVCDATYARSVKQFGEEGVIDITGVVGYYTMLAMIMNVARTAIDDGSPPPLPPLPQRLEKV